MPHLEQIKPVKNINKNTETVVETIQTTVPKKGIPNINKPKKILIENPDKILLTEGKDNA